MCECVSFIVRALFCVEEAQRIGRQRERHATRIQRARLSSVESERAQIESSAAREILAKYRWVDSDVMLSPNTKATVPWSLKLKILTKNEL